MPCFCAAHRTAPVGLTEAGFRRQFFNSLPRRVEQRQAGQVDPNLSETALGATGHFFSVGLEIGPPDHSRKVEEYARELARAQENYESRFQQSVCWDLRYSIEFFGIRALARVNVISM